MSDDVREARERVAQLEADVARLTAENTRLGGVAPPRDARSGRFVVLFFGGLMLASVLTAFTIWTLARRTAREREARRLAERPAPSRVEAVGRAIVGGATRCLVDSATAGEASIVLRVKVTPAGTMGLAHAEAKPADTDLAPCVRKVPAGLRVEPDPAAQNPLDVEVRYRQGLDSSGNFEAKWSWRVAP